MRYWIPDSLSVDLGFRILIVSGIPDSLSCIPDSKAQDSGFQKQKFPGFSIQLQKFPEKPFFSARQILWEICRPICALLFPLLNFPEIEVLKVNVSIRCNRPPGPEIGTAWYSQHPAQGAFCLRSLNW